jgi:hypothetical protein
MIRAICFSRRIGPLESLLTLNGRNMPVAWSVKYLGKKMTCRLRIETVVTKAFKTFIRLHSLFKSERLSTNLKLTIHKTLIMSVMTYACPAWKFVADTHLLKLQCLQNRVRRTTGKFPRSTKIHDMCMAF